MPAFLTRSRKPLKAQIQRSAGEPSPFSRGMFNRYYSCCQDPMSNAKRLMCTPPQILAVALSVATSFAVASTSLQAEINKLMGVMGWPDMARIALQRGDLQKAAKAKLAGPDKAACIDKQYTEQRVLAEISAGYAEVYTDPAIVAETSKFMSSPGAKKILAAVASRAPAAGAGTAYEENKSSAWNSLTSEERDRFTAFANSPAGKAYDEVRSRQIQAHQRRLARLANEIVAECSRR